MNTKQKNNNKLNPQKMKGTIVKHESNPTWYVKYTNKKNKNVYWPLTPESLLIQKTTPNMEVNFKITEDGKAKIIIQQEESINYLPPEIISLCEQLVADVDQSSIPTCPYPIGTQGYLDWTNGFQNALDWIKYQTIN